MRLHIKDFVSLAVGVLTLAVAQANAAWTGATTGTTIDNPHRYLLTGNWAGATIDDSFAGVTLTGNTRLYLNGNHTTTAGMNFGYGGAFGLRLLAEDTTVRTLTLSGNISGDFGGTSDQTASIGLLGASNPLNLDLGAATRTITVTDGGDSFNIESQISGGAGVGIIKAGGGTLFLQGNNSYTGTVTVNANSGILKISHSSALGSTSSGTTINAGSRLQLTGNIAVGSESLVVATLENVSGNNSWAGDIQAAAATQMTFTSTAGNLTIDGAVNATGSDGAHTFNIGGAGSGVINGTVLNSTLNLNKINAGIWILNANNAYTSPTNINAGTLLVNGTHTGGGQYTVASGATLGGTGSTASAVTVNSGGFLAPGTSIESFGVGSSTINGTLKIELNAGLGAIDVLNASGNLNIGSATVDFDVTGTPSAIAYVFATYGSLVGTFAPLNIIDLPANYTINYSYQGNQIALVQVPEPVTWTMLAVSMVSLIGFRRMRRCP